MPPHALDSQPEKSVLKEARQRCHKVIILLHVVAYQSNFDKPCGEGGHVVLLNRFWSGLG